MTDFITKNLNDDADVIAPDGFEVRLLATSSRGSMAHFELPVGETSKAIRHTTVEELWFFTAGEGELWRKSDSAEELTEIFPGMSVSIPVGTAFQIKSTGEEPLEAIAVTMPPWPGADEAKAVTGRW